jgi:hypothetical protein
LLHIELWQKAAERTGEYLPENTFRSWLKDCHIKPQRQYPKEEVYWVFKYAKLKAQYPKGSPWPKRKLYTLMESKTNG